MASQVPGGALADAMRDKRLAIAVAIVATLVSALLIAFSPTLLSIGFAETLHAFSTQSGVARRERGLDASPD